MRTSFELKIAAENLTVSKQIAIEAVAKFLGIKEDEVLDAVNLELKVSYPEAKTYAEISEHMDTPLFVVTVFGSVKQSVTRPFGL